MKVLVAVLLGACGADALIHGGTYSVEKDPTDDEGKATLGVFGYSDSGECKVTVYSTGEEAGLFVRDEPNKTSTGIGFFLRPVENLHKQVVVGQECYKKVSGDITFNMKKDPKECEKDCTYSDVAPVNNKGFYALTMYQCTPNGEKSVFQSRKLKLRVSEYNLVGSKPNYLQVGDQLLPMIFMLFAMAFFGLLIKWSIWMSDNKQYLHKIHFFMSAALFLKAGTLFFESVRYFHYRVHGNNDDFYDVMYYMFLAIKGILLFSVIVLIGSGWSFVKPFLHQRDKHILMMVIPLQLTINILAIAVDHLRDGDPRWSVYEEWLEILNLVCCCVVILPILWSVKQFREASTMDGKVAKNLARTKQFRTLYLAIVTYIYFKTVICDMVLAKMVPYQYTWIPPTVTELSTMACFVFVGLKFRPMKENPYTDLDEEDYAEGGVVLDQELEDVAAAARPDSENPQIASGGGISLTETTEDRKAPSQSTLSTIRKVPEADF